LVCALFLGFASPGFAQVDAKTLLGKSVQDVGPEYDEIDRAIERFTQRDIAGARTLLDQATSRHRELPPAEILLGKLFYLANQAAAGRAAMEQAVVKFPGDPEPFLIFADQAFAAGRVSDAHLLFGWAAKLNRTFDANPLRKQDFSIRSNAGLAAVAQRRTDWKTAMAYLNAWIEIDAQAAAAYQRRGQVQFMLKDYAAAQNDFAKAAELDARLPLAGVTMGRMFDQEGDRVRAKQYMNQAIGEAMQAEKINMVSAMAIVRWLVETQQYNVVKPMLKRILAQDPKLLDALLFSGVVARLTGDDREALDYFEQAVLINPSSFDATNQLALLLASQPDDEQRRRGIQYAEANARLHNNSSEAAITLGWIYYQAGRTQDAERILNAALKAGAQSADSKYFVAKIFYDRGRSAEAKSLVEAALRTKAVFVHRQEATDLLNKIKASPG
jgi:tetratricopeptide (TPR) repeat protein